MRSIRSKVLALILLLTVLPSVALILIVRVRFDRVVQTQALDIASQFMRQNAGYLELYLDEIETTVRYIADTRVVRDAVEADQYHEMYEALLASRAVATEISRIGVLRPEISVLEIHAANGFSYRDGLPGYRSYEEVLDRPMNQPIVAAGGGAVWFYDSASRNLVIGQQLLRHGTRRPIAVFLAQVPLHRIENVLGRFREGGERELLLLQREKEAVIGRQRSRIDVLAEAPRDTGPGQVSVRRAGGGFLIASTPIGIAGLELVMVVSQASLLSGSIGLQQFLLMAIIGVMLLTALAWIRFSHGITDPIRRLVATMEQFEEGRTSVTAEVGSSDEIGELARAYNRMLGRLNQLIGEVYLEQIHRRDAEWDALQAQINPHFLNNTLNSIGSLARLRGATDITGMVASLSRMFSLVIYEKAQFVPLSKEIEYVRLYVQIQEVRFASRLRVDFDIPESLCDVCVPRFALQPLVENAIVHGIEPSPSGGTVRVSARTDETGAKLILEVRDNGVGMAAETLHAVRHGQINGTARIGLRNIDERIRSCAGDRFGISVNSVPGGGTTVTVTVPADGCGEPQL